MNQILLLNIVEFNHLNFQYLIIDHAESCFFLPFLNPLFHYGNLPKVFNWPAQARKQSAHTKTFPSK